MEVRKNLRIIEGPNFGKYPYSNSLLVGRSCLIDTGAREALKDVRVDWILNSHWHEDHIALNRVGRRVAVHHLDAEAVQNYEEFKRRYALGDLVKLFVNFEFGRVDRTFEDGDVFEFEGIQVEVLHTPGHSAGHSCFVIGGVMFLADVDLTPFGPWYGCLDCDVRDFVLSIEKIKNEVRKREVSLAIPSHGKPVSGTEEILRRLDDYLREGQEDKGASAVRGGSCREGCHLKESARAEGDIPPLREDNDRKAPNCAPRRALPLKSGKSLPDDLIVWH
ncbi:MAG: MBL fold metallo-hydrolase [Archaeoglobus sp.]|nr:MBL fold metallo-hydrolase [Archaeoglobus sp.]